MPNANALSTTCSIACTCMSPPGQPITSSEPSSRTAIAGFGRQARTPARADPRGVPRVGPRLLAALGRDDAEPGDDRAAERAVGRHRREREAVGVDDAHVRRVARARVERAERRRQVHGEVGRAPDRLRHARRRARRVDRGEARVGVRGRQELVEPDVDEGRVAVAVLAVGEGALQHLEHEVHVARIVERRGLECRPAPGPRAPARAPGPGTTGRRSAPRSRASGCAPPARSASGTTARSSRVR